MMLLIETWNAHCSECRKRAKFRVTTKRGDSVSLCEQCASTLIATVVEGINL